MFRCVVCPHPALSLTSTLRPRFDVDSRRDGGGQEFNAAKEAILSVHKDAKVVPNRIDSYPITVTVTKGEEVVWTGRQQGLFGKNGRPAQKDIVEALKARE